MDDEVSAYKNIYQTSTVLGIILRMGKIARHNRGHYPFNGESGEISKTCIHSVIDGTQGSIPRDRNIAVSLSFHVHPLRRPYSLCRLISYIGSERKIKLEKYQGLFSGSPAKRAMSTMRQIYRQLVDPKLVNSMTAQCVSVKTCFWSGARGSTS